MAKIGVEYIEHFGPAIYAQLRKVAEGLARHFIGEEEELGPESVWETKGRGVTLRNEQSPVTLFEAVAAFRRYVHGLPVLGRASVHTGFRGANELSKWGVDWRARAKEPMVEADVVDAVEGAKRIMADVQSRLPERSLTLEDLEPERMTLGYLSMPRRYDQRVLQPAWVAQFRPRRSTLGMVVSVPAAPAPFESIALPGRTSWQR